MDIKISPDIKKCLRSGMEGCRFSQSILAKEGVCDHPQCAGRTPEAQAKIMFEDGIFKPKSNMTGGGKFASRRRKNK